MTRPPVDSLLQFQWLDQKNNEDTADDLLFPRLLTAGCIENIEEIDTLISQNLEHWDISRLAKVDLAIIRISVFSLVFQPDIPHSVTIDEAVHLAKQFGADDSYRFINGVLDGIRKRLALK
jgi:N utilization substance protein B